MTFKRAPLAAYLCLLPILLTLGNWQLNRAEEKRELLKLQAQRQSVSPISLNSTLPESSETVRYLQVMANGRYDSQHQFLLDNQVHKGRVGYHVLTPFRIKHSSQSVLVNRGWLPLGKSRADLPDLKVSGFDSALTGRINHFPKVGLVLQGAEIPSEGWPAIVQVIDAKRLSERLGYPLPDFIIELDATAPHGFVREWQQAVVMTPEKHTAYAVQWFLLALTLTVLLLKYGVNKP